MSISIPTPENLKSKAKLARQFLKEQSKVNVSHSHCLELISQLFGFKDWNTANAELPNEAPYEPWERIIALASIRSKSTKIDSSVRGMTVGEIRKALEGFDDSATVDFDYEYNLGEYFNSFDELNAPEDNIRQEFAAVSISKVDDDYANLKLALKNEELSF